MKKIASLLIIAISLLSFTALQAQDIPADERASSRTKKMVVELSLNDQQLPQVRELNLKFIQKADELKKAKDKRGLDKLKADYDTKLKAILTPEQFSKYSELKKEKEASKKSN